MHWRHNFYFYSFQIQRFFSKQNTNNKSNGLRFFGLPFYDLSTKNSTNELIPQPRFEVILTVAFLSLMPPLIIFASVSQCSSSKLFKCFMPRMIIDEFSNSSPPNSCNWFNKETVNLKMSLGCLFSPRNLRLEMKPQLYVWWRANQFLILCSPKLFLALNHPKCVHN